MTDDAQIPTPADAEKKVEDEAIKKAADAAANVAAQKGEISAALERALFIKFWTWLLAISIVAVAAVTGIARLALEGQEVLLKEQIDSLKADAAKQRETSQAALIESVKNQAKSDASATASVAALTKIQDNLEKSEGVTKVVNTINPAANSLGQDETFRSASADSIMSRLKLELVAGEKVAATRNKDDANFRVSGACPSETVLVSYYCQIDSGGGTLQNIGVTENQFYCIWNSVGENFSGWGRPVCLRLSRK